MGPTRVLSAPDGPHVGPRTSLLGKSFACRAQKRAESSSSASANKATNQVITHSVHMCINLYEKPFEILSCHGSTYRVNSLCSKRYGGHFECVIWQHILRNDILQVALSSGEYRGTSLIISQYCFKQWLGAEQATGHYLNQWWPRYSTRYTWVTSEQWVNDTVKRHRQALSVPIRMTSLALAIATVSVKQTWRVLVNRSYNSTRKWKINIKPHTNKEIVSILSMGYTVCIFISKWLKPIIHYGVLPWTSFRITGPLRGIQLSPADSPKSVSNE